MAELRQSDKEKDEELKGRRKRFKAHVRNAKHNKYQRSHCWDGTKMAQSKHKDIAANISMLV